MAQIKKSFIFKSITEYEFKEMVSKVPPRGPLTCCMFPRIFCPSRWISLVTTWGYFLLMEFRAPLGSLASSESRTAWTVVARFMWVSASTWPIAEPAGNGKNVTQMWQLMLQPRWMGPTCEHITTTWTFNKNNLKTSLKPDFWLF